LPNRASAFDVTSTKTKTSGMLIVWSHSHGVRDAAIRHATDHPIVVVDLGPDGDPPKQPSGRITPATCLK